MGSVQDSSLAPSSARDMIDGVLFGAKFLFNPNHHIDMRKPSFGHGLCNCVGPLAHIASLVGVQFGRRNNDGKVNITFGMMVTPNIQSNL